MRLCIRLSLNDLPNQAMTAIINANPELLTKTYHDRLALELLTESNLDDHLTLIGFHKLARGNVLRETIAIVQKVYQSARLHGRVNIGDFKYSDGVLIANFEIMEIPSRLGTNLGDLIITSPGIKFARDTDVEVQLVSWKEILTFIKDPLVAEFEFIPNRKPVELSHTYPTADSKLTYNERIYKDIIIQAIPDIHPDDVKWLCNKSATLYKSIKDACIDNYRVCRDDGNGQSVAYRCQVDEGCCGSVDNYYKNEYTGNTYWIGFNYGH